MNRRNREIPKINSILQEYKTLLLSLNHFQQSTRIKNAIKQLENSVADGVVAVMVAGGFLPPWFVLKAYFLLFLS